MNLKISQKNNDGVTVGRIVFGEEANFVRREVKEVLTSSGTPVVLNLADVPYVDSGGLGALVGLYHSARSMGADIKFACPTAKVEHVFEITHLAAVVGLFPSEELAVAAIRNRATA
jgi:anti-sigma B factor antagonist